MVSIPSLWLPIVLSGVLVFVVSSLVHTVLRFHANDFRKLPDEDAVADALRKQNVVPGQYHFPHASSGQDMKSAEYQEKVKRGPGGILTVWAGGPISMSGPLIQWFVYTLVVGVFAAYIAGRALQTGADYPAVFRFVGATAFACYAIAGWQDSIWFKKPWGTTVRNTVDGLIYALLTGGMFGWLWPR